MNELISIIVPVYNAQIVLDRCVESIINQTYRMWELILINDGSTDSSGAICDNYAENDSRIRVVHKENGGVSSARNYGLKEARGEYVTFIDADDWIESTYLKDLLSLGDADIIISGFHFCDETVYFNSATLIPRLYGEVAKKILTNRLLISTPWCKLFKRGILATSGLYFDKRIRLGEDTIFCLEYLGKCNSLKIVEGTGYHYTGEWGGSYKYLLTFEEVRYFTVRSYGVWEHLKSKFSFELPPSCYDSTVERLEGLYTKYTDMDIYCIYKNANPNLELQDFINDKRISIIYKGLLQLRSLYCSGNNNVARDMILTLNNFYTIDAKYIKDYSLRCKFEFLLIRKKINWVTDIYMRVLYGFCAKLKNKL